MVIEEDEEENVAAIVREYKKRYSQKQYVAARKAYTRQKEDELKNAHSALRQSRISIEARRGRINKLKRRKSELKFNSEMSRTEKDKPTEKGADRILEDFHPDKFQNGY